MIAQSNDKESVEKGDSSQKGDSNKKSSYGSIRDHEAEENGGGETANEEDSSRNPLLGVYLFEKQARLRDPDRPSPSGSQSIAESFRSLVESGSLVLGGSSNCSVRDFGGTATIPSEIINMVKNLIGGGVLSLPGGIALYANNPAAVLEAFLWISVLGATFGYFCLLIAKACVKVEAATYREVWQESMGSRWSLAVSLCNAFKPALANLAYSTILSDTFRSLFQTAGFDLSRTTCLLLISFCGILPLCLLKNLTVLTPFSVLGTGAILLTACAMIWRFADGSYQPGGQFHDDADLLVQPSFGGDNRAWSVAVLPFCCMLYTSFVMHYNCPRFYTELKDRTIGRYMKVVGYSFGITAGVYMAIASAGFLTFGGRTDPYILNNYSPHDPLASVCRVAVALATLTTYPIVFIGFRDGVLDVLKVSADKQTAALLNALTLLLLTILTVSAVFVTDLGLINAVGGGTVAVAIVFVFPTLMYRSAVLPSSAAAAAWEKREVVVAQVLMVFGVILGIIGLWVAIAGPCSSTKGDEFNRMAATD